MTSQKISSGRTVKCSCCYTEHSLGRELLRKTVRCATCDATLYVPPLRLVVVNPEKAA
jgi:hypothetical protein